MANGNPRRYRSHQPRHTSLRPTGNVDQDFTMRRPRILLSCPLIQVSRHRGGCKRHIRWASLHHRTWLVSQTSYTHQPTFSLFSKIIPTFWNLHFKFLILILEVWQKFKYLRKYLKIKGGCIVTFPPKSEMQGIFRILHNRIKIRKKSTIRKVVRTLILRINNSEKLLTNKGRKSFNKKLVA